MPFRVYLSHSVAPHELGAIYGMAQLAEGRGLQAIVSDVEAGRYGAHLDRVFSLDDIVDAHRYMEENRATGKVVGVP